MFMHTAQHDSILGPMRFVSKLDDYQVYRALLPKLITNQKMQAYLAYKTYLALATGVATPKKARKFKKPASLSKRKLLSFLGVFVSKKKAPATGGSGDGVSFQPEVPDEPKGKSVDTHKGTGLKLGVPDVFKADYSKSEYESWSDNRDEDVEYQQDDEENALESDDDLQQADDEQTDSKNQKTNDEDEESEDAFVHTLEDYVPTDDEMNDHNNEEKGDAEMTDAAHVQVEQTQEQTTGDRSKVVQKWQVLNSSYYVSSTYTNAFLNLENLYSTKTKVVSMMDINLQHEVPRTSPLLTILVFVIPEHTVFNLYETVTTAPTTTITSLLSSLIIDLEKDVKELKNVDNSTIVISKIKYKVPNAIKEYLGSSLDDALYKVIQKHSADIFKEHSILAEIVKRLKQQYAP
ncbi:hypothetical protein Tco_0839405 [Tanacetum coccineum]|uniref:Uncharacterized protein n=1 Tax=Tanacetum coccineum TaxID=301880 RepID=A0ABQ5ARE4_9ASTR